MATLYPMGYGKDMVTMSQMRARHENHMEPEFARRLFNWLGAQGGFIGIGGGRRTVQPDKPGFAPAGKSFHQDQVFFDGTSWYSAVDLVHINPGNVHRSPTWAEVPKQGTLEASRYGVHCNVDQGATPEPWHMQAVPQDGYDSWVRAGKPRPTPNYLIPGGSTPGQPTQPPEEDDEVFIEFARSNGEVYARYTNGTKIWYPDDGTLGMATGLTQLAGRDGSIHEYPDLTVFAACGQVVGENAPGHDAWGNRTS